MADTGRDVSPISFSPGQELQTRILIIAIRAIGDVVLITPLLSLLKKAFPTGYMTVLVDGPTADVLAHNPSVDRYIRIDRSESQKETCWRRGKNWVHLIGDIRKERFDIVLDLFSGARSAILSYFSGAGKRYGEDFRSHGRGFLYNYPIKINRDGRHLIEQKLDLVRTLLEKNNLQAGALELFLTEGERQQGQRLLEKKIDEPVRRIGLIPSAGSIWRMWPFERYAELADALIHTYGVEIILLGGVNDMSVCRAIGECMRTKPVDLSGQTTLRELIAVLGELDLVISNVTGPMHLAVALAQPKVIGLYGAADIAQYAPWGPAAFMLTKGTKEEAYWRNVDYEKDYSWLLQIDVEDVLAVIPKIIPEWA